MFYYAKIAIYFILTLIMILNCLGYVFEIRKQNKYKKSLLVVERSTLRKTNNPYATLHYTKEKKYE